MTGSAPGGGRFTRQQRLLTPRQFQAVFRRGRRQRFGALEVITLHNDTGWPRLGLVIPKRQVRLAVDRNRLKRWIREAFRHHQLRLPAADMVVRVHGAALTHDQVDAAFERLCGGSS
ncbi:ribonuclease P protein component [Immundisolibacter sp.]|uniref:ribonuclease P protein component n=1 Tax=Immundisolibacter sp. TaxID=1934948 RepID=UPI003568D662